MNWVFSIHWVSHSLNTHQDLKQRGTAGCIFRETDVVERFAEDGSVIILIDQVNKNTGESHVVGHGLIGKELDRRGGGERLFKVT